MTVRLFGFQKIYKDWSFGCIMVTINIGRKEATFFGVIILIFVVAGLAIAFGGTQPEVMGHSAGEMQVILGGETMTLQAAIDGRMMGGGVSNSR